MPFSNRWRSSENRSAGSASAVVSVFSSECSRRLNRVWRWYLCSITYYSCLPLRTTLPGTRGETGVDNASMHSLQVAPSIQMSSEQLCPSGQANAGLFKHKGDTRIKYHCTSLGLWPDPYSRPRHGNSGHWEETTDPINGKVNQDSAAGVRTRKIMGALGELSCLDPFSPPVDLLIPNHEQSLLVNPPICSAFCGDSDSWVKFMSDSLHAIHVFVQTLAENYHACYPNFIVCTVPRLNDRSIRFLPAGNCLCSIRANTNHP